MPTFRDATGREWSVKFTPALAAEIARRFHITLFGQDGTDPGNLFELLADDELTRLLATVLIREQAVRTYSPFLDLQARLSIPEVLNAARRAIEDAACEYLPTEDGRVLECVLLTRRDHPTLRGPALKSKAMRMHDATYTPPRRARIHYQVRSR